MPIWVCAIRKKGKYVATKKSKGELVVKDTSSGDLTSLNNQQVAAQLHALAEQVQTGAIRGYEFKQTANSVSFTVDSADGKQRIIKKETVLPGLVRRQTDHVAQQPPAERRKVVKELAQEGLSQVEIAKRTLRSQKTISNDIQKLKDDGEL